MGRLFPKSKILLMLLVLVIADVIAVTNFRMADAAQLSVRSIQMSTSQPGATNVTYGVSFKATTATANVKGIIVDFCDNSPTAGNSCTTPNLGLFNLTATPTFTSVALNGATALPGTWTATGVNTFGTSQFRTFKMSNSTTNALTAGNQYSFTISGASMVNPSVTASPTFYARILDYSATAGDYTNYTDILPGSASGLLDYGGVALSIASAVNITSRVAESMVFCVAGAAITTSCANAAANPPTLTLGHGSPVPELTAGQVDTTTAYMQASTNAVSGVVVRMRNITGGTCGGMSTDGGTTCGIPALNSGSATASAITAGTAAFGMYSTLGSTTIGNLSPTAPFNGGTTNYDMDTVTAGANVLTTYGEQIASSTGPLSSANNTLTFGATASAVTPAGIYTSNIVIVCTGTF
jgi:hypothetical protein